MYQMLKNAFTYNLIQYSNREHAIYLYFQGPYAICRTHSFLYSNLYLWNFLSMKYVLFRMIISIFYCLKFFTIKCASFCSVERGEKNEKSEETRLQMHAPVHFAVIQLFRYDVDQVPSPSGRQVQTGEKHSCPCQRF